jgi:hypothetical protein
MTPIPAKIVSVTRIDEQYFVAVQVGHENYAGTFDGLNFGKKKPQIGWYHSGWLDLPITEIPALKQESFSRCGRFNKLSSVFTPNFCTRSEVFPQAQKDPAPTGGR